MAYTSGTANTMANLATYIASFAGSNGWTYGAGGVLYNANGAVRITVPDGSTLKIEGANDSGFSDQCPKYSQICDPVFPVQYDLFAFNSPDFVACLILYNNIRQWCAWGDLTKYGAWTGGNWFGATCTNSPSTRVPSIYNATDNALNPASPPYVYPVGRGSSGGLFLYSLGWNAKNQDNDKREGDGSFLHCEEYSGSPYKWANGAQFCDLLNQVSNPMGTVYSRPLVQQLLLASPNTWNSQTILLPFWIGCNNTPGGQIALLGDIPWIRHMRMDYYNDGDVITLGSDKWKVFPWIHKDISMGRADWSSQTLGWAIKYTGL